jgi:Uma2 family endonuclease
LFTVAEYHRMAEAGILKEDDRLELIEGEVVAMSPIGSRHAACVKKVAALIRKLLGDAAIIGVQDPVQLDDRSEPQPDLSILRPSDDFYAAAHPGPGSVLLLIEVADASIFEDRTIKIPLYARSGIGEVWLVDLVRNVVELYSDPGAAGYAQIQRHERGATVVSSVLPGLRVPVSEILVG